jgi:hypothetical protein
MGILKAIFLTIASFIACPIGAVIGAIEGPIKVIDMFVEDETEG